MSSIRTASLFALVSLVGCVHAEPPAAVAMEERSPWDLGPARVSLSTLDANEGGRRWGVRLYVDDDVVNVWPGHPIDEATLESKEHTLTCVVFERDGANGATGANDVAFVHHFSVASGCLTDIAAAPLLRETGRPSVTVVERVACRPAYAAMALIPQPRELPLPPSPESGASVRTYVATCDAQAKDETRYLEEAVAIARAGKDVVVAVILQDYLARVLRLRTRLEATAAVGDDADANAAHATLNRAHVICEALRQMQNEARQAVAID